MSEETQAGFKDMLDIFFFPQKFEDRISAINDYIAKLEAEVKRLEASSKAYKRLWENALAREQAHLDTEVER